MRAASAMSAIDVRRSRRRSTTSPPSRGRFRCSPAKSSACWARPARRVDADSHDDDAAAADERHGAGRGSDIVRTPTSAGDQRHPAGDDERHRRASENLIIFEVVGVPRISASKLIDELLAAGSDRMARQTIMLSGGMRRRVESPAASFTNRGSFSRRADGGLVPYRASGCGK